MNASFQQLLDDLYLSVTKPEHWRYFAGHMIQFFSASAIHILLLDKKNPEHGFSLYYDERQSRKDIIALALSQPLELSDRQQLSAPEFVAQSSEKISYQLYSGTRDLLMKADTDFFKDENFSVILGALSIDKTDSCDANYQAGFRLYKDNNSSSFKQQDISRYADLLPHFLRAVKLHRQYIQKNEVCRSNFYIMDSIPMGLVLMDIFTNIEYMNKAAGQFLNGNSLLSEKNGKLTCSDNNSMVQLRLLIRQCLQKKTKQVMSIPGKDDPPVYLSFLPVLNNKADIFQHKPMIIVCLNDPSYCEEIPFGILQEMFGFSPAEAKLAAQLVKCSNLKQAGQITGISDSTARSYLKRIFIKAEVSSQAELIKRIITSPAIYQ